MEKFYFTFGTSEQFPYRGGWVEVIAPDRPTAHHTSHATSPAVHEGIVHSPDIYTVAQFESSGMSSGNRGSFCHEILSYKEEL